MEIAGLGALALLLLVWIAVQKGKSDAKKENTEETLDAIKKAKEIRDGVNSKPVRRKLRDFLNDTNK